MNRTISFIAAIIAAISLFLFTILSCTPKELEEVPVERVSINQPMAEMEIGETIQLSATVSPSNATHKEITWSSSNKSVASVSNAGLVTALAEGNTKIYAAADGKIAECTITVSKRSVEVTSISLNKEELSLIEGDSETLIATVKPDDATDKTVTWTSSNSSIATVENGKVIAIKEGTTTITAKAGEKQASCVVAVSKRVIPSGNYEYVDLGLSVNWATFNVGASKPEDYGEYYAWGETESKSNYSWSTYKYCKGSNTAMTKYCSNSSYGNNGFTDAKTTLLPEDDVAHVKWGGNWRIPTKAEQDELRNNCTWTWYSRGNTEFNGIAGYKVTSKVTGYTDHSIFLPVAGSWEGASLYSVSLYSVGLYGDYWSSTLNTDIPCHAYYLYFDSDVVSFYDIWNRYAGRSVRPVCPKETPNDPTSTKRITSVTLDTKSLTLKVGDEYSLKATAWSGNEEVDTATITWKSDNESVTTVSMDGLVKAISVGTTTITAKAGEKQASCVVAVSKRVIPVESVELNKTSLDLIEGDSETLIATVKPDDATDKTVTWTSSNSSIATVENGKVIAIKEGTTTITAKAGEKQASCVVAVSKRVIPVESVELNKTSLELIEGDSETLIATVKPDNATDKTVTWTSSNSSIATVENGKVIAIKEGTTTITAKAGEKQATCSVKVKKKPIPVTNLTLDKENLTILVGNEVTLIATVLPDDATDKTVTWKSSNTGAVTVKNGVIKGVGTGKATITATAGNISATCEVLVVYDSEAGVSAKYYGGSISMINGKIQNGSQLNFGVVNYSSETIHVVSVQLIDGQTGQEGNVMNIDADIVPGSSAAWTITIGVLGIYEPTARFVYTFKGESYTCEAKYVSINWNF